MKTIQYFCMYDFRSAGIFPMSHGAELADALSMRANDKLAILVDLMNLILVIFGKALVIDQR